LGGQNDAMMITQRQQIALHSMALFVFALICSHAASADHRIICAGAVR
jgi:hypothetical protein